MRWLTFFVFACAAGGASAETVTICYNYGCQSEAEARYSAEQLAQVGALLGAAQNAADERERLAPAIGWLLGWAGQQTPIAADRGGNYADDAVFGRMDCIDHATTTTRLLQLIEQRGWLQFHQVVAPVRRVRYLFAVHFSAQIEEIRVPAADPQATAEPARFVVDSWFRDNGQPAVVMPLANWRDGDEPGGAPVTLLAGRPGDDQPRKR